MKRCFICFVVLFWAKVSLALPFEGAKFVVSGPSPHSPIVAKSLFRQGGNVVDMAVAVALSLTVTHPYYVSLGSGGFALVKLKSSIKALDFRETAPGKMSPDFFEKSRLSSRKGGASVGVPGFVAGLFELHKKYGRLSWSQVIQPAIVLAEKGFPVSGDWIRINEKSKGKWDSFGKKIFLKSGRSAYKPNEIFKQKKWAKALKLLKKTGRKAFYEGPLGQDVVLAVQQQKGVLTKKDLKQYRVRWLEPVSVSFRGYEVYSMPLPSSGGIILSRALKFIERQKVFKKPLYSEDEMHLLAEIMSRAFWPRSLMGDPDFSKIPTDGWLSDENLKTMNQGISLKKVRRLAPPKEPEETTHISLIDSQGNAVAMTLTLNGFYGSGIVSPKYGIVLNNQMDDFTTLLGQPNMFGLFQGKSNSVQGGKRPLSSMTPVIVEKNKQTVMVIGGAGGPMIINGVLQSLYRHLVNKLDIEQAVQAPRLHHQFLPRDLFVEDKRFSPELLTGLKLRGHKIQFKNYIAQIFAVARTPEGRLQGAVENRREGSTGGL